ncbi:MAG: DUF6438 domain-containing protein [Myxococcota bacterium]
MTRLVLVLLVAASCATAPPAVDSERTSPHSDAAAGGLSAEAGAGPRGAGSGAQVVAALYRGPCLGRCPEYQVVVFSHGGVQYRGERNVAVVGEAWGSLTQEQLTALDNLFAEFHFQDFASRYEHLDTTDLPLVILSWRNKLVRHAHGDSGAPRELTDLEDAVDRLLNTAQWVKGPEK